MNWTGRTVLITGAGGFIASHARLRRTNVQIASSPPFFPHISGRILAALRRAPLVLEVRDRCIALLGGIGYDVMPLQGGRDASGDEFVATACLEA
jgi:hypothetical protein